MVRKTSSGFFPSFTSHTPYQDSTPLPFHVSRGYDQVGQSPQNPSDYESPIEISSRGNKPLLAHSSIANHGSLHPLSTVPNFIPLRTKTSHQILPKIDAKPAPFDPSHYTVPYMTFMTNNPTVFHAVNHWTSQLEKAGYKELSERSLSWDVSPGGKYYITRNKSSFIAFSIGKDYKSGNGIAMVGGHTDEVTAKLKPVSKLPTKAGYIQLGVAPYAGAMSSTWWDRDLGIGGKVVVKNSKTGKFEERLAKLDWPIARIPTLAVHFGTPSQGPFNLETQAVPIIGLESATTQGQLEQIRSKLKPGTFAADQPEFLVAAISSSMGIDNYSDIISWELELFDTQPAQLGGLNKEFIFAGRIDDKLCTWSAVEALVASTTDSTSSDNSRTSSDSSSSIIKLVGGFDNEEIGSLLKQGARSNFMASTIERICESLSTEGRYSPNVYSATLANSFLISSDVTHAVNPNFLGQYLVNHSPRLNTGIVMHADPNGHTTTDSVSSALLKRVAEKCDCQLQLFQIRNDSRSGGTIGPMTSAALGVRAIDACLPQLSMHSMRATTGALDPGLGVKLYKGFFDHYEEVDEEFQ